MLCQESQASASAQIAEQAGQLRQGQVHSTDQLVEDGVVSL
jgi:hypothetical protein